MTHFLISLGAIWTLAFYLWPVAAALALGIWLRERHWKKRERAAYLICMNRYDPKGYMPNLAVDSALREARRGPIAGGKL